MTETFKIGDRVILTGEGIIPFPDWPVWGSKYSCAGTIVDTPAIFLRILWDNGASKTMSPSSLSHYDEQEEGGLSPNVAFMLHKRNNDDKS